MKRNWDMKEKKINVNIGPKLMELTQTDEYVNTAKTQQVREPLSLVKRTP